MENKSVEKTKSSRKKKTLSLIDFIVKSSQKTEKSPSNNRKITKKVANVFVRRGKVKKKKKSTLKKKILKLRNEQKSVETVESESQSCESDQFQDDSSKVFESAEIDGDCQQVAAELMNATDRLSDLTVNNHHAKMRKCEDTNEIQSINAVDDPICTSVQHSRNFRDYCNHLITNEIRNLAVEILESLLKFQENKYQENPSESDSITR